MPKRLKRHVVTHLYRKPLLPPKPSGSNLGVGIVYVVAAVLCIALGAFFYKGYRNSEAALLANAPPDQHQFDVPDVPPGATVITRVPGSKPAPSPSAPPTVARAKPASEPEAPFENIPPAADHGASTGITPESSAQTAPAVARPPVDIDKIPPIKRLPTKPWSATFTDQIVLQQVRLFATADTAIVLNPDAEPERNFGGQTQLAVRGNDSIVLQKFDTKRIAGWTIKRATWHAKVKQGSLKAVGFSTVTADWEEGKGDGKTTATGGATYEWADHGKRRWRADEAPAPFVMRGNGRSLMSAASVDKGETETNDWLVVTLDPVIVQALVAKVSYGIAVSDEKGQLDAGAVIASREDTNSVPYIEIEGAISDVSPPGPITDLRAFAPPALQRAKSVGVLLAWTATGDDGKEGQAFAYEVRYGHTPAAFEKASAVPRCQIPYPQPSGARDQMVIDGLEPDSAYMFFIRAVDKAGQPGPASIVNFTTPPLLKLPTIAAPATYEGGGSDVSADLGLCIVDETGGMDALAGASTDAAKPAEGRTRGGSLFWDRSSRTLHLAAAQNETVGFLIALQKKAEKFPSVRLSAQTFQSSKGTMGGKGFMFYRTWFAPTAGERGAWRGDALIPLEGKFSLAQPTNAAPNLKGQLVYAEVAVPAGSIPGNYRSQIALTREGGPESRLNVFLDVLPIQLPERPRFNIELAAPASLAVMYKKDLAKKDETLPIEEQYFELAKEHRCVLGVVPYLRNGATPGPYTPPVSGQSADLTVSSWSEWDAHLGGLLSGVWPSEPPQSHHNPLPYIILPIYENWPGSFEDGFICLDDEVASPAGGFKVFAGSSDGIYGCMSSDYWRAIRSAVQQFKNHFRLNKWSESAVHLWLNNVPSAGYSGKPAVWFLGAPLYRDDFLALESYADVAKAAASDWPAGLVFRVNVPYVAALSDRGIDHFDLLCVSDTNRAAWAELRDRVLLTDERLWFQSDVLPVEEDTLNVEVAALRFFLQGADGWSIREAAGRPDAWIHVQPQSILYCGQPLGSEVAFPSLRLKTLRRAQQDADYLLALQDKMGWTRSQLADFVYVQIPGLAAGGPVTCADIGLLRRTAQELLTKK